MKKSKEVYKRNIFLYYFLKDVNIYIYIYISMYMRKHVRKLNISSIWYVAGIGFYY